MSKLLRLNPKFDYAKYGLDHLAQEADEAAISFLKRLDDLGSLTTKLILEDAPRLKKIQAQMKEKRCWVEWLDTKFEKSKSTAYNILEISNVLETCSDTDRDRILEEVSRWSQRALMALWGTGDNREAALAAFLGNLKPPTQKQVESFQPISGEEKEELLKQVDKYATEEQLGVEDPKILRLRVESQASELADNQNKKKPGVADYERAFRVVTGKDPKPLSGVRTHATAGQIEEMRQHLREQATLKEKLTQENDELRKANKDLETDLQKAFDRIRQLEQLLEKIGVAA